MIGPPASSSSLERLEQELTIRVGSLTMNLKHLYYFHIFANELSTTKAAQRLGISSPALSNQLKQLEEFVGGPLVDRVGGRFVLTEQGKLVLQYANPMFEAYETLKARFPLSKDSRKRQFRVGFCQNLGSRFSLDLLSLLAGPDFSAAEKAHVVFDSSERLLARFLDNEFDVILGSFVPDAAPKNGHLLVRTFSLPVRLLVPRRLLEGARRKGRQPATLELRQVVELARAKKVPLVLPMRPSLLFHEIEKYLSKADLRVFKSIECNSSGAVVQLIESGLAMGFLPVPVSVDLKAAKDLVAFGPADGYWKHEVSALARTGF